MVYLFYSYFSQNLNIKPFHRKKIILAAQSNELGSLSNYPALEELTMPTYFFLMMLSLDNYVINRPSNYEFAFAVTVLYELLLGKYLVAVPSDDSSIKLFGVAPNIKQLAEPVDILVRIAYVKIQQSDHPHDLKQWLTRFQGWTLDSGTIYQLTTTWVRTYSTYLKEKQILRDIDSSPTSANNHKYFLTEDLIKYQLVKLIEIILLGREIHLNPQFEQKLLFCTFLYGYFGFTASRLTRSELDRGKKQIKEVIIPKLDEIGKGCLVALQQASK